MSEKQSAQALAAKYAPQIEGRIILVTGVSPSTLGATFVEALAAHSRPRLLILAGRSPAKMEATMAVVRRLIDQNKNEMTQVRTLKLDLGSLATVRAAAAELLSWDPAVLPHIDVLVNNAAVMALNTYELSPDGFERQLATNHLGPFLLTNLIMGKLLASPSRTPRVVNVASDGHQMSPFRFADHNFEGGALYNKWRAYGQSKTANMLMALALSQTPGLASRGLLAFSLHPGVIWTQLAVHLDWTKETAELVALEKELGNSIGWAKEFTMVDADEGTATHIYAAFDESLEDHNGAYLERCALADAWADRVKPWGTSPVEAARLWKLSEKLVGQNFNYDESKMV